jgi:hypothetical protein
MSARVRVLYLPTDADGNARWALVADQAGDLAGDDREALRAFASEAGAQGCLVLSGTVELAQGDDPADEQLAADLGEWLRTAMAPPADQKPKLPPPNTTEGKLARSWQGGVRKTTEGDPRS